MCFAEAVQISLQALNGGLRRFVARGFGHVSQFANGRSRVQDRPRTHIGAP